MKKQLTITKKSVVPPLHPLEWKYYWPLIRLDIYYSANSSLESSVQPPTVGVKDIASAPVGRVKVYRIFFPSPQAVEFLSATFLVPVKVVCPLEAVTVYATEIAAAD